MKNKLPVGQRLADECARMMGWVESSLGVYWGRKDENGTMHDFMCEVDLFKPHLSYDQCRIVEDWIWENGLWKKWALKCAVLAKAPNDIGAWCVNRSTASQRCQTALQAWKESKRE